MTLSIYTSILLTSVKNNKFYEIIFFIKNYIIEIVIQIIIREIN